MIRLFALLLFLAGATAASAETFLILPFFNATGTANLDWVGESISESIREAIASEGPIVVDRDDRHEAFRRLSLRPSAQMTKGSIVLLGQSLDADQVVYGSFEMTPAAPGAPKSRGNLHITAQILDLRKSKIGPEYLEQGSLEDLAKLQSHLAWQTLQFVTPATSPSELEFSKRQPVIRLAALENCVRGLLATSTELKTKLFAEAVRLEPNYSQANYQLGRLHHQKKNYKTAAEHLAKVSPTDDHFREANFFLGLCKYYLGDYAGAQEAFQLVANSVPLNEVLNNLAAAQSRRNLPEALQNFRKALEGDASDPDYQFNVGYALFRQGNLAEAADRFRAVLDRDPEDAEATTMLGRCLKKSQQPGQPRASDSGVERLKQTYEETAYRQLKAVLEPKR